MSFLNNKGFDAGINTVLFLLFGVILIVGLVSQPQSQTRVSPARWDISYVRDAKTDLCFAVIRRYHQTQQLSRDVTNVPCTDVVLSQIRDPD